MIASRLVPVAVFAVLAASLSVGCKTKVDPSAFDSGVAAVPSTDPSTATTAAADTTVDAGSAEALAPIETSKPVAAGTAAKPKPTASAAPDPAECVAARAACGGSSGAAVTLQARKKCNDATSACVAKGGHL